ncbi:hypothetical protein IGI04_031375 [Brassica rapa subsp. trilocularis]|uniref:Uncharacterized protein n=1 Tax=Brassica rapa subsp. trilocularis TaxID=1813537 RepID=A0ABQ7LWQ8_BRACM|nr:hypothetical protein IGI04_031375 [Brassica rapa subsp. trilocularis]
MRHNNRTASPPLWGARVTFCSYGIQSNCFVYGRDAMLREWRAGSFDTVLVDGKELHNIRDYDDHLRLGRNSRALSDRNSSEKAASPDANYL